MSDIAGVRTEFIQGAGYELAWEAILLAVVSFLFVRLQSSPRADLFAASVRFFRGSRFCPAVFPTFCLILSVLSRHPPSM